MPQTSQDRPKLPAPWARIGISQAKATNGLRIGLHQCFSPVTQANGSELTDTSPLLGKLLCPWLAFQTKPFIQHLL